MTTLQREKAGNVMTTLQRMNILFAHDFSKLRSIETQESKPIRELQWRTIGQHCYLAEEVLEPDELAQLKQAFQLNTVQWQAYKAKGIEGLTNMRE
jgi:hypothetical protein